MRRFLLCLSLLFAGLAHADGPALKPLKLNATDGQTYTPLAPEEKRPVLLFFISLDCPVTADFISEINHIAAEYSSRVATYIVHSQATRSDIFEVRRKASLKNITAPVLLDSKVRLAKRLQSSVRPEAVVVTTGGKTLYQGRITDLYLDPLKRQQTATTRDLRDALDAILSGGAVAEPQHAAQGCKVAGIMRGEPHPFAVQAIIVISAVLFFAAHLTPFILGFLKGKRRTAIGVGWGMLLITFLSIDLFIPAVAVQYYGQAMPDSLLSETPGTVAIIMIGWLPALIAYVAGDIARGINDLVRGRFSKKTLP